VLAGHMSELEAKKGPSRSSGRGDTRTKAEDAFFRESNPQKKKRRIKKLLLSFSFFFFLFFLLSRRGRGDFTWRAAVATVCSPEGTF